MNLILEQLKKHVPRFLTPFNAREYHGKLPTSWNVGEAFVSKEIFCKCGNENFFLLTYELREKKGIFRKKAVITKYAPVYLHCSKCGLNGELFNPEMHGWNGEFGDSPPELTKNGAVLFSENAGEIVVNYSYQGVENYQEMIDDPDISNPEDYFDTFTIYFRENNGELLEVTSCECA